MDFLHHKSAPLGLAVAICLTATLTLLGVGAAQQPPAQAQSANNDKAPATPAPASSEQPASTNSTTSTSGVKHKLPALNYVLVGTRSFELGKYEEAYVAFRIASQIEPKNANALLGLGRSQIKLRLYEAALETLQQLIELHPQNLSGYIALSQAYQQQYIGASKRQQLGQNLDLALTILQNAEPIAQTQRSERRALNLSKVYNERGNIYRLKGQVNSAIDAFKSAALLNPDNSLILFNLGDMYQLSGDTAKAISTLQRAVITDPSDAYNRAYYAKLLALSGNIDNAQLEAAQASRMAPNNAYAQGQYGVVSYLAKKPVLARHQMTKAIQLEALRFPEFYYYLGRLELDSGNYKAARQQLTKAAALASNAPDYLYYLGLSYEQGNSASAPDKVKARENYQLVLKLHPNHAAAKKGLERLE